MSTPADDLAKPPIPPPTADLAPSDDAIEARRRSLPRESLVRSIGLFCLLAGLLAFLPAIGELMTATGSEQNQRFAADDSVERPLGLAIAPWVVAGLLAMVVGYGLRGLQGWARWLGIATSALATIGGIAAATRLVTLHSAGQVPTIVELGVGSLIAAYLFVALIGSKSAAVCSSGHRELVRATPKIQAGTAPIGYLAVVLIVGAMVWNLFGIVSNYVESTRQRDGGTRGGATREGETPVGEPK